MFIIYVIINLSSDRRIHDGRSYFVDVRRDSRHGHQMAARNPGTHAEAHAIVDRLRAEAVKSGHAIQFVVDDIAGRYEALEATRVSA